MSKFVLFLIAVITQILTSEYDQTADKAVLLPTVPRLPSYKEVRNYVYQMRGFIRNEFSPRTRARREAELFVNKIELYLDAQDRYKKGEPMRKGVKAVARLFRKAFRAIGRNSDGRQVLTKSNALSEYADILGLQKTKNGRLAFTVVNDKLENVGEEITNVCLTSTLGGEKGFTPQFTPTHAVTKDVDYKKLLQNMYEQCVNVHPPMVYQEPKFINSKKLWNGPAMHSLMFNIVDESGKKVANAIRLLAHLVSITSVKAAYNTEERGIKVVACNLSTMDDAVIQDFVNRGYIKDAEAFKQYLGNRESIVRGATCENEIDGQIIGGRNAIPNDNPFDPCQFRIMPYWEQNVIDELTAIDNEFRENLSARWKASPYIQPREVREIYNTCVKEAFDKASNISAETIYGKGLCVFLGDDVVNRNVLLLDVNGIKDSHKDLVKAAVKENGYYLYNTCNVALLQDYGQGTLNASWQLVQQLRCELPQWFEGSNYKEGDFGFDRAINKGWKNFKDCIARLEQGEITEKLTKYLEVGAIDDSGEEVVGGESQIDADDVGDSLTHKVRLDSILWNHKMGRKALEKSIQDFCRRARLQFMTDGMDQQGMLLPGKRYLWDANFVDATTTVELRDGAGNITKVEATNIVLSDHEFWDQVEKAGLDTRSMLGCDFRHPVSDIEVVGPCLLLNPEHLDLKFRCPNGCGVNSSVIKEILVGDTDGDTVGFFPCLFEYKHCEDGVIRITDEGVTRDDYAAFYTASTMPFHVLPSEKTEAWVCNAVSKPLPLDLEVAENVVGRSNSMVGNTALINGISTRLMYMILMNKVALLSEKDWRRKLTRNQANAWGSLSQHERYELMRVLLWNIVVPTARMSGACVEASISLQKKDMLDTIASLLELLYFGNQISQEDYIENKTWIQQADHGADDVYSSSAVAKKVHELVINAKAAIMTGRPYIPAKAEDLRAEILSANTFKPSENGRFDDSWAKGIGDIIQTYFQVIGIGIDHGNMVKPVVWDSDTSLRFADMVKTIDPEFAFGSKEGNAWGIGENSNLLDSLARWDANAKKHIQEIRNICAEWSKDRDYRSWQVSLWNRALPFGEWSDFVNAVPLCDKLLPVIGELYRNKFMWFELGFKTPQPETKDFRTTYKRRHFTKAFREGMKAVEGNSEATILAYLVVKTMFGKNDFCGGNFFRLMSRILCENAIICRSKGWDAKQFANRIFDGKDGMALNALEAEDTTLKFLVNQLDVHNPGLKNNFLSLISDVAGIMTFVGNANPEDDCFDLAYDWVTEYVSSYGSLFCKSEEDFAVLAGAVLCFKYWNYNTTMGICQSDYTKVANYMKKMREKVDLKSPFRVRCNEILESLPRVVKISMWAWGHASFTGKKPSFQDKLNSGEPLVKILLESGIPNVEKQLMSKNPLDGHLTQWAVDTMQEEGFFSSTNMGIKACFRVLAKKGEVFTPGQRYVAKPFYREIDDIDHTKHKGDSKQTRPLNGVNLYLIEEDGSLTKKLLIREGGATSIYARMMTGFDYIIPNVIERPDWQTDKRPSANAAVTNYILNKVPSLQQLGIKGFHGVVENDAFLKNTMRIEYRYYMCDQNITRLFNDVLKQMDGTWEKGVSHSDENIRVRENHTLGIRLEVYPDKTIQLKAIEVDDEVWENTQEMPAFEEEIQSMPAFQQDTQETIDDIPAFDPQATVLDMKPFDINDFPDFALTYEEEVK